MKRSISKILFLITLAFNVSYSQDLEQDLILNYSFTNNFEDQSVHLFHGTATGVNFTEDRFANQQSASYFSGNSCVTFPNDAILKPQFPFSITVWVKPEVEFTIAEGIVGTDQFQDNYYGAFISILSSGKLLVSYGTGCGGTDPSCRVSEVSDRILGNNEWYHITAIFENSADIFLYINGCRAETTASGTGAQLLAYSNEPGAVGKKDHSDVPSNPIGFFHGSIDDIFYWDRAIDIFEINLLVADYFQNQNSMVEYEGCTDDDYSIVVNETTYNESNPIGVEVLLIEDGCDSVIDVKLNFEAVVVCNFYLPNVFNIDDPIPNNNFQLLQNDECKNEFEILQIFDRWGNLIFSTTDQYFQWDGRFNGEYIRSGVFTYKLDYSTKEKSFIKTGSVIFIN